MEGLPERVSALEEIAADHEDRLVSLEAEVAAVNMLNIGVAERLNVQRMVISSHSADLTGIGESLDTITLRLEMALRILARYRGFSRSQAAVIRMLEQGTAADEIGQRILTEPLL